jgi:hypothetical protein
MVVHSSREEEPKLGIHQSVKEEGSGESVSVSGKKDENEHVAVALSGGL